MHIIQIQVLLISIFSYVLSQCEKASTSKAEGYAVFLTPYLAESEDASAACPVSLLLAANI